MTGPYYHIVHGIALGDGLNVDSLPRGIVAQGQLESAWPVHGSVLVVNGMLYAAAGRSSYLDGGMYLVALEPHTGNLQFHKILDSRQPDGAQVFDEEGVEGYLNDVLSSNGEVVFLRHQVFDLNGNRRNAVATSGLGRRATCSGTPWTTNEVRPETLAGIGEHRLR